MALANPSPCDISIAGERRDQKLAAIITPPVKPNIPSRTFRLSSLKRKTSPAPAAVTSQVKVVAIRAPHTGLIDSKKEITDCIVYVVPFDEGSRKGRGA
jgi:hypothetical protein